MSLPRAIRRQLSMLKGNVEYNLNKVRSVKSIFNSIYSSNAWGDGQSVSGTGSNVEQTVEVRRVLPELFRRYNIKSILDIPCGDFNWMQHVDLSEVDYRGADIVKRIVAFNQARFGRSNISFYVADVTKATLPQVDLILCRDCLVHLSNYHVLQAISRIVSSGSNYLLATTFSSQGATDIVTGSWRPMNLEREPFCFPRPLELINEGYHPPGSGVSDKSLGLWRIADIPNAFS